MRPQVKGISILGSTGSIGRQTLEVIDLFPDHFNVVALAAGRNVKLIREQIRKYKPRVVSVFYSQDAEILSKESGRNGPEIYWGADGLLAVATCSDACTVVTAVTGTAGLIPTVAAIKAGKQIALANKETLVAAGSLVMELAKKYGVEIFPVDSEHSAIWQCLRGSRPEEIDSIILTASGGPFWKEPQDLSQVTLSMALNHPNWSMGRKITIDSATLMNKGLEIIEAKWFFNLEYERIRVVVHPQSIIHSMVEFTDGSVLAQMGLPDMRLPIQFALAYPQRLPNNMPRLKWSGLKELTFMQPDTGRFPLLDLAYQAGRQGGTIPAAMNAANEVAVELFLDGKISFASIHQVVQETLVHHHQVSTPEMADILEADRKARESARLLAGKL